ncbi:MAG TPA: hypothetical protein PKC43_13815 [Phycisphaerales bacterium]|nr:hypothetical protein [Phycisphaerales bacterium]HMP38510.1 hypothetical protein [Phycisphaerales bacterium]
MSGRSRSGGEGRAPRGRRGGVHPRPEPGQGLGQDRAADPEGAGAEPAPLQTPRPVRRRGKPTKERLEALIRLARFYRGWPTKEVAAHLDRHVHNLVPESGVPKVDLVVGLAELLDWPVEVVIDDLYALSAPPPVGCAAPHPAELHDRLRMLWELVDSDRLDDAVRAGEELLSSTLEPNAFCYASSVLADALEGLGHYLQAIDVLRRGLRLARRENPLRGTMRAHLAYCHYVLGDFCEAEALATASIAELASVPATDQRRTIVAASHFIRGSCLRIRCALGGTPSREDATAALSDLTIASAIYEERAETEDPARLRSLAQTAVFAALEVRVILGELEPREAIGFILHQIEALDPEQSMTKHEAESLAWGCVFGSTIVMRHLRAEADADRLLAILTNLADLLANRLGHWALRERCWTIEHLWRVDSEGGDFVFDIDDIQTLTGTMGRFPMFRERGWDLLARWRRTGDET